MNLIIDIGNTRVKVAVFEETKLVNQFVCSQKDWLKKVEALIEKQPITTGIVAATGFVTKKTVQLINKKVALIWLDSTTKIPFINLYKTPKTLGIDRTALVVNAVQKFSKKNVLVIDAGTCITYDFVTNKKEYLGGAISPGIAMRYQALNSQTQKLPLLEAKKPKKYLGNTTAESIHSGVVNGVLQEINGVIAQYKKDYQDLTIVLTGGDTNFLSKQLKSSIFANPNFVLEGLNAILIYNKKGC